MRRDITPHLVTIDFKQDYNFQFRYLSSCKKVHCQFKINIEKHIFNAALEKVLTGDSMDKQNIEIVAEYETFAVIRKPGGMLSVPGRGPEKADCAVLRFRQHFPDSIVQAAVHRLDMETSGLLVMAKTAHTHRALSMQFEARQVYKEYVAVVDGIVEADSGRIELPFRLDVDNRPYQIYDEVHGKMGVTEWEKLSVENGQTRVRFVPLTGRTHQLRLHSSHSKGLGFPIVGDCLYGTGTDYYSLKLHAAYLSFYHPQTGEKLEFNSQIPF